MRENGFTFIEVIITLVIAALLATMLFSYFGTAITGGAAPVSSLETTLSAQSAMENITADYMANYQSNLTGLKNAVGAEGGDVNAAYGQGTVVDNHFITWNADVNAPSGISNCLEVTIRDPSGQTLTQIYTTGNQGINCQ